MPNSTLTLRAFMVALLASTWASVLIARPAKKPRIVQIALVFDYSGRWTEVPDIEHGLALAGADSADQDIQFRFQHFDSKENGVGTIAAMEKAIASHPDVIVAEVHSSKAAVAAILAEKAHRVMITPFATSPTVTNGKSFVFRSCFNDSFQGVSLARFARLNHAASRVAIVTDVTQLYSRTLAESFRNEFLAHGGSVVLEENVLPSTISFSDLITRIVSSKPNLVFLPLYEQTAARIMSESVKLGYGNLRFLGGDGWAASNALRDLVFKSSSTLDASWVSHYSGDFSKQNLAQAKKRLKDLRKVDLNGASAIGYDTGLIIAQAFLHLGKNYTQEELANSIRKLPKISGLTGDFSFGASQDPTKSIFIRRVLNHVMVPDIEVKP